MLVSVPRVVHHQHRRVEFIAQIGVLLWGSLEALSYWRRMQKRTAIGLADPAVTNRFLLWGIGAGAAGVGSLIGTRLRGVFEMDPPVTPRRAVS